MSNLLDKASIILTPTAYNNGEALCVKPSDGSGDFDFSRNSAATRVNAQGLVENVQILSSNLVQNGDFSEEGVQEVSNGSFSQEGVELLSQPVNLVTDFTTNSGGVIVDADTFTTSGGAVDGIKKLSFLTVGKSYKLIIEGDTTSSGFTLGILVNGNEYGSGFGTHYFKATTQDLWVRQQTLGTTNITSFSIVEVGQDWTLGTGWSIGEDKASSDGSQTSNSSLFQPNVLTQNKYYKFEFTLSNVTSGAVRLRNGIGDSETYISYQNSNGTYTAYSIVNSINKTLVVDADSNFIGSITNISVKEVGQNWVLDANWSIAEDKAVSDGANGFIRTSTNVFESGKTYKVGITVSNMTTGQVTYPYDGAGYTDISTNGDFSQIYYADSTNRCWIYGRNGFDGSVTNISVIEITDDTNLPRINYEGFSYQDALGIEQIVNGGFDSDTAWTKGAGWSIANGTATYDGTGGTSALIQNGVIEINKTYKVTIDVISNEGSGINTIFLGNNAINTQHLEVGSYTFYGASTSGIGLAIYGRSGEIFKIDNVSVKEYLGQEPIPNSGCGHWLWEPQSTNLITQSELFSDASWVKINSSVASGFASPSGNTNAYKLIGSVSNTDHRTRTAPIATAAVGTTVTFSIYIKPQEITKIALVDNWTNLSYGVVNLSTNSVIEEAQGTISVTEILNGFRRVSFTYQTANINTLPAVYLLDDSYTSGNPTSYTFASDGTSGVYIWGAQLEQQSYATSYIPTSGSTVTRNQDVCTNGGSLASINSTEGVLYAEIAALANDGTTRIISLSDGTTANRVNLFFDTSNTLRAFITGVPSIATAAVITDNNKVALKFKSGDISVWLNGTEVATSTSTISLSGLSNLSFNQVGSSPFFGKTKALAVWKEALSDEELTELTTI